MNRELYREVGRLDHPCLGHIVHGTVQYSTSGPPRTRRVRGGSQSQALVGRVGTLAAARCSFHAMASFAFQNLRAGVVREGVRHKVWYRYDGVVLAQRLVLLY